MSDRALLLAGTVLAGLVLAHPGRAETATRGMVNAPVPPMPASSEIDSAMAFLARDINTPITGASVSGRITGGDRPPSLEAMQALRPDSLPGEGADGLRAEMVCQQAKSYGARGGLAARSFAIKDVLRRYEPQMDVAFDFGELMVPATARTALVPPVVTEAQMAFALGEGGQTARETGRIYQITRRARLAAVKPNWRAYLVRDWSAPTPPPDVARPRTDKEAAAWTRCVAQGWADGERLATDNFLTDLAMLGSDLIGMARYHVLLRAGLVEQPRVALRHIRVQGGGTDMRVNDTQIQITGQRGLNPDQGRWRGTPNVAPDSPIGRIAP